MNVVDLPRDGADEEGQLSIKQLKSNLKETLKKSGVLSTVKAQIRQEFINGLSAKPQRGTVAVPDISDRIVYSCVYHLFRNRKLHNSISVFIAECGLDPKFSLLSEEDVVRMVKFNQLGDAFADKENALLTPRMRENNRVTVIDLMLHFCLTVGATKQDAGTQSEAAGTTARELLDDALADLRSTYRASRESELLRPSKTIEERMVAFQRDCEKRMLSDVAVQVAHIRENEVARVRLQEAARCREEAEAARKQTEFEYNRRLQAHMDSETASAKRLSEQEQETQRQLYEARQLMQREIDQLRTRETAGARKQELESQGVRLLELRLKEAQGVIETREAEIARRERKADELREGAAEAARREATAQVQAELDVLSRERSSLALDRRRFQDTVAAHAAEVGAAGVVREQLRAAKDQLMFGEEELASAQRSYQRAAKHRDEEEERMRAMVAQVDPSFAAYSRAEQIIALVRQNAELEVKLASFQDAGRLHQRLAEKEQEWGDAQRELRDLRAQQESEGRFFKGEREQLLRGLAAEQARVASGAHKLEELRQLAADKSRTIESLQRQLDAQQRPRGMGALVPSTGSRTGWGGTGVAGDRGGSVASRRALDFLARSGHFDEDTVGAVDHRAGSRGGGGGGPEADVRAGQLSDAIFDKLLLRMGQGALGVVPAPPALAQHAPAPAPSSSAAAEASLALQRQQAVLQEERVRADERSVHMAVVERERQQVAELNAALQREQLRTADLHAQVEQQKMASAHLALRAERDRLEAREQERERDVERETRESERQRQEGRQRDSERETERDKEREREIYTQREMEKERERGAQARALQQVLEQEVSLSSQPASAPASASASDPPPGWVTLSAFSTEATLQPKLDVLYSDEGSPSTDQGLEAEAAARLRAAEATAEEAEARRLREAEATLAEGRQEAERVSREAAAEVKAAEAKAAEEKAAETKAAEAKAAQEKAAEAKAAEEKAADLKVAAAQEAREAWAAGLREAEEKAAQEAKDSEREQENERDQEREREEAQEKEREQRESMEQQRETERAKEEEQRRKQTEDAAAIQEARAKVLARRRQKQQLDQPILSSSLPTSLSAAAGAGARSDDVSGFDTSGSVNRSNFSGPGGVASSIDSALPAKKAEPRNLFARSSFQSLQDSDSSDSGPKMEVGDMSEENEGDKSRW